MLCIGEEWKNCNFTGTIKKYENEPKSSKEPIEIMDDYDMRHKFGCKMTTVHSRFDVEEM